MSDGFRILMVEDDDAVVFALGRFFRRHRLEVETARTVEAALERLASSDPPPELVLTDLRLDDRDPLGGLEVVSAARGRSPRLPIVVMSAHATLEVAEQARASGADRVLEKPLDLERLLEDMRRLVAGRSEL